MNDRSAANVSVREDLNSSKDFPSKTEGIALCSAFMFISVLVVSGNLLTITLYVKNKSIRKEKLSPPVNMAFADLLLRAVSLHIYTYDVGFDFSLWTSRNGDLDENQPFLIFFLTVDSFRKPRLFLLSSYPARDFTPFTGHLSTELYPRERTALLFSSCGSSLSLTLRFGLGQI